MVGELLIYPLIGSSQCTHQESASKIENMSTTEHMRCCRHLTPENLTLIEYITASPNTTLESDTLPSHISSKNILVVSRTHQSPLYLTASLPKGTNPLPHPCHQNKCLCQIPTPQRIQSTLLHRTLEMLHCSEGKRYIVRKTSNPPCSHKKSLHLVSSESTATWKVHIPRHFFGARRWRATRMRVVR